MADQLLQLLCHHRRLLYIGKKLIQFVLPLDPPDGQDIIKPGQVHISSPGIIDQSSGQGFHGDKSHVCFPALFHQLYILVSGKVTERELQRLIKAGINGFIGHRQPVVCNADMFYLSLCLGLQHGFIEAGAVTWARTEGRIMELVYIHMVCLQVVQRDLQIFPESLHCGGHGLGSHYHLVPDSLQGNPHLFLAVRITPGRIKKVDAPFICLSDQTDSIFI